MGIIDSIKAAILSKRIKASVTPSINLASDSLDQYLDTITPYVNGLKVAINTTGNIVSRHADEIAQAIVILQPVFKEFKESETFRSLFSELTTQIVNISETYAPKFEQSITEIKEACEIKE